MFILKKNIKYMYLFIKKKYGQNIMHIHDPEIVFNDMSNNNKLCDIMREYSKHRILKIISLLIDLCQYKYNYYNNLNISDNNSIEIYNFQDTNLINQQTIPTIINDSLTSATYTHENNIAPNELFNLIKIPQNIEITHTNTESSHVSEILKQLSILPVQHPEQGLKQHLEQRPEQQLEQQLEQRPEQRPEQPPEQPPEQRPEYHPVQGLRQPNLLIDSDSSHMSDLLNTLSIPIGQPKKSIVESNSPQLSLLLNTLSIPTGQANLSESSQMAELIEQISNSSVKHPVQSVMHPSEHPSMHPSMHPSVQMQVQSPVQSDLIEMANLLKIISLPQDTDIRPAQTTVQRLDQSNNLLDDSESLHMSALLDTQLSPSVQAPIQPNLSLESNSVLPDIIDLSYMPDLHSQSLSYDKDDDDDDDDDDIEKDDEDDEDDDDDDEDDDDDDEDEDEDEEKEESDTFMSDDSYVYGIPGTNYKDDEEVVYAVDEEEVDEDDDEYDDDDEDEEEVDEEEVDEEEVDDDNGGLKKVKQKYTHASKINNKMKNKINNLNTEDSTELLTIIMNYLSTK